METIFAYGQFGYDLTPNEKRIKFLYEHLNNMPPWSWDWKNYGKDNKHMIGKFYPQDVENIKQLDYFGIQLAERTRR